MGKRFEGEHPSFRDVLTGFKVLGIEWLLGAPGQYTAFSAPASPLADDFEFYTVPGDFTKEELLALMKDAGLMPLSDQVIHAA